MTDPAFGRLLYTDCAPGTGRGSGGGFQIQAQSPSVDPRQASFAVGWLLYEAQSAWVAARRPVEDFPLGFAHSSAEGYGTAQGRYVGKEAVGGRMGNHLADCLLTRDYGLYGTIRPAQLWHSPLWRAEPWDARDCPDFDGNLELGPLGLEEVTAWVRARAERGPALELLLSVLEDPNGQRAVIASADADEAMRWIAAATLLLPQRQALEVSFKVFSSAPLRAQQRVVAAPPDVSPDLRPGAGLGIFVLDAATCAADEATVTERAAFLVSRLAGDTDPYDIVDAADLAYELGGRRWPQDIATLHAAWALTRPDDPVTEPDEILRWLQQAGNAPLREHGAALAGALLAPASARASAGLLRWLDAQAADGELEFDHDVIRMRLLDAEIADMLAGQAAPSEPLRHAGLTEQALRDAESTLTSALLRGADDDEVDFAEADRVLRLARRHGISLEPPSPSVEQFVADFAAAWIDSNKPDDPWDWALRERIIGAARAELGRRLVKDPASKGARDTAGRFFPYFKGLTDPDDPLYWPMQATVIRGLPAQDKITSIESLLKAIGRLRRINPAQADRAEKNMQQALLDWDAMTERIAVKISTEVSQSRVNPEIDSHAREWLEKATGAPNADVLTVLRGLDQRSPLPASSQLHDLIQGDKKVDLFLRHAASGKTGAAVRALREADDEVLVIRADEILDAIAEDTELAAGVYLDLPKSSPTRRRKAVPALTEKLGKRTAGLQTLDDRVNFAIWCVSVLAHRGLSGKRREGLEGVLDTLYLTITSGKGGPKESEGWMDEVRRSLRDDAQVDTWESLTRYLTRRRIRGIR
jgi:GTPase-associated protein 1, N-terminal domain type 2/GTPase-associated protein 1, middle domain